MFVQVLFPFLTLLLMFLRKIKAVRTKTVRASYFKLNRAQAVDVPDDIVVVSNHYDNLFQMPVLFLVGATLVVTLNLVDTTMLIFAWLFVFTRILHSMIHLRTNHLQQRYYIFGSSCLVLLGMWMTVIGKIFSL